MSRAQEIWVRNDQGKVWGPLQAATLELMFESGLIPGKVQVSLDGRNFVFAGRLPSVRDAVPRDQWGDVVVEAPAPTGAPIAGPGAVAAAARAGISVDPPTPDAAPTPPAGPTPPAASASPVAPVAAVTSVGALPSSGDLEAQSAVALFGLAASSEVNALVTLVLRDRQLSIHFRKGNADLVDSTHADDGLGAFLVRQGLLTADALAKADAQKDRFGGELLPALFGSGALNPGTAFQHLATRAAGLLQQAVAATSGRFTVEAKELPAARAFPLGNRWQPLTDAVRRLAISEVRRRLGPLVDHPVMKSGSQVQVADLRLSPQELRAFGFFDGVRSLAQLAVDLPAEADVLARTAWYLKELGAVSFAAVKVPVKAAAASAAPAPPPAAAPAAPPAPAPVAAAPAPASAPASSAGPLDFAALAAAAMAAAASAAQAAVAPPSAPQPLPPPIVAPPPIRPAAGAGGGPGPGPGAKPPVVTAAAPMAGPGTRAQVVTSAAPAAKPAAAPAAPAAPAAKPDLAAELPALRKIFGALKD
ncbi:MAG: molecular chaperone DnaJ, partial [Myxococcaceae bacterium]|nr:molecular chaperone DnaJ [Myxococcaceae bacterium]